LLALKKYQGKERGVSDLLNAAALVDDGIVLNKDGSLTAGWFYRGPDIASCTFQERNALSARLNAALSHLGSGWISQNDACRQTVTGYCTGKTGFPDPVTAMIDEERRRQFEAEGAHFETTYVFTLTWLPPLLRQRKVIDLMFTDDGEGKSKKGVARNVIADFKRGIDEIEGRLSAVVELERMREVPYEDEWGVSHVCDMLLQHIQYCVTGLNHPVNIPPCPMYLDSVIGGQDLWGGIIPRIGEKFIGAVGIDGFPAESYPNILAGLDQIPMEYRWSTRFIYLDPVEAVAMIKGYRRKWAQKVRGFTEQIFKSGKGVVDQDALEMVRETDSAVAEASGALVGYGYYTSVVVIFDEDRDRLEVNLRDVCREIRNLGFSARVESVNAMEAWLGAIPGHGVQNVRRPVLHTMGLSDMLPMSSIWAGVEYNPCPFYPPGSPPLLFAATSGSTPFRLNLHVGDLGHTLIFGPTGAGKSTILAFIAASFRRYFNATVFAFDKGCSMYPLAKAMGESHYAIAGENQELSFCPLGGIDTDAEQGWAEEWISTLIELQGVTILPKHRNEIHQAMSLLRESRVRTLTELHATLQDHELREALEHYTLGGGMGRLLDSQDENVRLGAFQVFEIEELMALGDKNVIPVLLYLFHVIEKSLKGQPALLILDEAWVMLGHPVFREKIREWLKVMRKANCAVILSTQSLSDAVRSGILDVLLESCPTKIFLPNEEAGNGGSGGVLGPRDVYELFGLNARQIEIIQNATKKRQYYFLSPEGRRLFELQLGPVALSFVGASGKEDLARIRELEVQYGKKWPFAWLRERGVNYEAP
jgi:type IV secretion/conjugal transfer VirB4 family ATPase